jgi:hypothetical protein
MFSRLSHPGIVLENLRELSLSIMAGSLIFPLFLGDWAILLLGIVIGGYYGYRIEKQTHELRTLGGRVMKCKSWDYLVLS